MATIITKNSSTASSVPTAAQLVQGELAVNVTDKRLFTENASGTVVELGTNPSSLTLPNGTANGLAFLNASKVLTTGSALTFDGTDLQSKNKIISGGVGGSNGYFQLNRSDAANLGSIQWVTSGDEMRYSNNNGGFHSWFIGSEQMRLTSTGLGIGTSSPARKLDVNGAARIGGAGGVGYIGFSSTVAFDTSAIGCAVTTGFGDSLGLAVQNATGVMTFATNSTERMRIDSSGNLGLGVTPSSTTDSGVLFLKNNMEIVFSGPQGNYISNAAWQTGVGFKYIANGGANWYEQNGGAHKWYTAPSGTAGNAISFTQAMTLGSNGSLGIGATSPSYVLNTNYTAPSSFTNAGGDFTQMWQASGTNALGVALSTGDSTARFVTNNGYKFAWNIASTQAMTLTAAGFLGVGTTAPAKNISVGAAAGSPGYSIDWTTDNGAKAKWQADHTTGEVQFYCFTNYFPTFYSNGSERARIDSSGNLLVGSSGIAALSNCRVGVLTSNEGIRIKNTVSSGATSATMIRFISNADATVGSIDSTGSSTSYNTSSDYRLKEDVQPMTGALAKVAALKPCTYKWKADGSDGEGFIAHELAEVVPQCVTGEKDAVDENGNPVYQGIDTSFLVATLTAAIQEQQAIIQSLTARVAALEAA